MSRGIERRTIFVDEAYGLRFLELLGEMSERYGVEVHAYVLMGNHYHLLLRTPEANASRAMQWLNLSYSAWFNAKRQRVGHVFQGRFRSTLVDGDGAWLLDMSAYVHLNPVRVSPLGLGKGANRAEALGLAEPDRDRIAARLKVLREHRWSSYRAYGHYTKPPDWLVTAELLRRAGGHAGYRQTVQQYVTRGLDPRQFEGLGERVAVGNRAFLDRARSLVGKVSAEQPGRSFLRRRVGFAEVVSAVEAVKGEPWSAFRNRHGDWGLAMVLYLARTRTGLTLQELGQQVGGMAYKNVNTRIRRLKQRLAYDPELRRIAEECSSQMTNDEM
jgi:REP element-mobilizing transposase RayT